MKRILKTFEDNLEQFELAKVKRKYEALGFQVYLNRTITRKNIKFSFDAYAKHPLSHEEIIFEVRAKNSLKPGDTKKIISQRNSYLTLFPRARFVLVITNEYKEPSFERSDFNQLLKNYIEAYEIENLKRTIINLISIDSVEEISIAKINFGDFKSIDLSGRGNLKFWIETNNKEFVGRSLSDGIPFNFKANLKYRKGKQIYFLDHETIIDFDLSEFK